MPKKTLTSLVLMSLLAISGCSREPAPQTSDDSSAQQLPFDRSADQKGIPPAPAIAQTSIPSGTPITVRLQSACDTSSAPRDCLPVDDQGLIEHRIE